MASGLDRLQWREAALNKRNNKDAFIPRVLFKLNTRQHFVNYNSTTTSSYNTIIIMFSYSHNLHVKASTFSIWMIIPNSGSILYYMQSNVCYTSWHTGTTLDLPKLDNVNTKSLTKAVNKNENNGTSLTSVLYNVYIKTCLRRFIDGFVGLNEQWQCFLDHVDGSKVIENLAGTVPTKQC